MAGGCVSVNSAHFNTLGGRCGLLCTAGGRWHAVPEARPRAGGRKELVPTAVQQPHRQRGLQTGKRLQYCHTWL